jgi:methionyl-tRNA formyltransferase
MLRYVFMGSPPLAATILERLCGELYPPIGVVTQEPKEAGRGRKLQPTAVEGFAKSRGLEVLATPNVNAPEALALLRSWQPDLLLVAAFGQILRNEVLALPRLFSLNVHASLLPRYRGAAPIQRAILDGDGKTGITIQKMARKLDTGDILLQREIAILPEETSGALMDRLAVLGGECLVESVRRIEAGTHTFQPQDERLATYAAKLTKEEAVLDWAKPADVLLRQIYGLQPWPVAETRLGGERLKVFAARVTDERRDEPPGSIATDHRGVLAVRTGDGRALSLTEIQLENRKRLAVEDFLKAYRGSFPYPKMG